MQTGLHVLLEDTIDYAGLFPPAMLSLDDAICNYARYRGQPEQWMLGRFICPATRLGELDAYADLFQEGKPFSFSVLGRGGATEDEWLANLKADVADAVSFRQRHLPCVVANVYEIKLPEWPSTSWMELIQSGLRTLSAEWTGGVTPFFEYGLTPDWRGSLAMVISSIAASIAVVGKPAGFKLRCGGLEARAFPTFEQVAFVLAVCRDMGVPLKFTAGLHHPVRHFDAGVGAHMHGFLNVFVAGVLAHAKQFGENALQPILADEKAEHFVFGDDCGVRWQNHAATFYDILAARRESVISFGSCSFDEPRDDLRSLGWL